MAKPIKPTPILKGTDAQKFLNKIKNQERITLQNEKLVNIKKDAVFLKSLLKH